MSTKTIYQSMLACHKEFCEYNRQVEKTLAELIQAIAPQKTEVTPTTYMTDLKTYEEKLDEAMWQVLEIIGRTGKAKNSDILYMLENQTLHYAATRYRMAIVKLLQLEILTGVPLKTPRISNTKLYSLTELGENLFCRKFRVKPVESEMFRIRRELYSFQHGYAIMEFGEMLKNTGRYEEVSIYNRKNEKNPGLSFDYVPDILCIPLHSENMEYFEYERTPTNTKVFFNKCNKMCKTTKTLNFIVWDKATLVNGLRPLVDKWIASLDPANLSDSIIRLTTAVTFLKNNADPKAWLIEYDLSKSDEPVIDKTLKVES